MRNIIRRNGENDPFASSMRDWLGPPRWPSLFNWDLSDLAPWNSQAMSSYIPEFDIKERPDAYLLRADLPGVNAEDLDIQASDNRLTVTGKREEEKEEKAASSHRVERSYGSFSRSFALPESIDSSQISAELKNGVLSLTVPKKVKRPSTSVKVNAT